jgi:D-alanyl-lipoteichoic acid acyltransferase DltB (MBOAT superfamily)
VPFTSVTYVAFLAAVVALFWLTPWRYRRHLLLAASLVFYATWDLWLLGLLAAVTVGTYSAGAVIPRLPTAGAKAVVLVYGLLLSVGLVAVFKVVAAVASDADPAGFSGGDAIVRDLLIPVGLSYYAFMAASYVIDVYRGDQKPSRSPLDYALFVAFFPHLLAGPILRAKRLIPAIQRLPEKFDPVLALEGVELLIFGYFRKVALGDPLLDNAAALITGRGGEVGENGSLMTAVGLLSLVLGIFFDASGYIDIARGSARLLGVRMQPNFAQPLTRTSDLTDLWQRWQITVMAWFRDYVFRPLRGSRPTETRETAALGATFVAVGVWHGLSATWFIWGVLMGTAVATHRLVRARRAAQRRAARHSSAQAGAGGGAGGAVATPVRSRSRLGGYLVAMAVFTLTTVWVVAPDVASGLDVYRSLLSFEGGEIDSNGMVLVLLAIGAVVLTDAREARRELRVGTWDPPPPLRTVSLAAMLVAVLVFSGGGGQAFFYVQF